MKFINIQTDKLKKCNLLSVEDKASLLDCIVNYAQNGIEPPDGVSAIVDVLFSQIQEDMEYSDKRYSKRCERNKLNAQRRWEEVGQMQSHTTAMQSHTTAMQSHTTAMQSHTTAMQSEVKDKDKSLFIDKTNSFSDDADMNKAIKDWLAYKKERGETYKPIGLKAFITHLTNLSCGRGDIALKIVEQSISNNYSGVFPLKGIQINDKPGIGIVLQGSTNKDYSKGGW